MFVSDSDGQFVSQASATTANPASRRSQRYVSVGRAPGHLEFRLRPSTLPTGGNGVFVVIKWRSWGGARATGSAVLEEDLRVPDCASGHLRSSDEHVELYRLRAFAGGRMA